MPPSSICQPTEASGSRGSDSRGEANEPDAHISAAPTQASRPSTVASPDCSPGLHEQRDAGEADEHGGRAAQAHPVARSPRA